MTGRLVISKAGHDKGSVYLVTACEGSFCYLADGRLRPASSPKKKNRKHLQPTNLSAEPELMEMIARKDAGADDRIRQVIKKYNLQTQ